MYHIFLETSEPFQIDDGEVTPVILTSIRKIMMIRMSSKFKDILDGFNYNKYPCIIYYNIWSKTNLSYHGGGGRLAKTIG